MTTLYRGEPLPRLNNHELDDGSIQPQSARIHEYTDTTVEEMVDGRSHSHMLGVDVDDLPGEMTHYTAEFTPGFTPNLGTGVFFSHYNMEDPGLVFAFDSEAIPGVQPIEYEIDWFHDHPGLLARVDTLSDGEIRLDGELLAVTDEGEVWQWGDRLSEALRGTYKDEGEWFTEETHIPVTTGLAAVTSYVGTNSATSGALDTHLSYFEDYNYGWGGTGDVNVDYMDRREKVESYHDEVSREMGMLGDELVVVLLEDQGRISKEDGSLREKFLLAYDGVEFYDTPGGVPDSQYRV
jgi:hypothetical protein